MFRFKFSATALLFSIAFCLAIAIGLVLGSGMSFRPASPSSSNLCLPTTNVQLLSEFVVPPTLNKSISTHIKTPASVKGIYMTSWVAGIPSWREKLLRLVDKSELNTIVIDVKDYSGKVSFKTLDPAIEGLGVEEIRVRDMPAFIARCHELGIYTIARITVFQDPEYAKKFPHYAVQSKFTGKVWRDRNGLSYVDPNCKPFWEYIVALAKASEQAGFDEINFDYIRFPTDGDMADMKFPLSGSLSTNHGSVSGTDNVSVTVSVTTYPKAKVLQQFFSYLHSNLSSLGVPISADLFGMVLTNRNDLNIGQILEVASPYFDYICPMIYPSHYPPGFKGFANPAEHPYEIVNFVLKMGASRLDKTAKTRHQLRPWLQDFNLGAHYDAQKIIAQKQATYEAGLSSWLMWNAGNVYTTSAYSSQKPADKTSHPSPSQ